MVLIKPAPSGVLVHEIDEPLGFGRGEVYVVGGAVPAGDTDCEPASPSAKAGWPSASALKEPDRVSFAMMIAVTLPTTI